MQVAQPRAIEPRTIGAAPGTGTAAARFYSVSEGAIDVARRDYIEALPIAALILCQDVEGRVFIDIANEVFKATAGWDQPDESEWIDQIPFFTGTCLGQTLREFLDRGERAYQFEGQDGRSINGRYFTVRLSKLNPTPYAPQRCLMVI